MKKTLPYISWFMLCVAVIAWGGIGYLVWEVRAEVEKMEFARIEEESLDVSESTAAKNRVTIRETAEERAALLKYLQGDLIQTIDSIEAVSQKAGAKVEISAATSDGSVQHPMEGVIVAAESAGTFAAMSKIAILFSSMPGPVFLERVELKRDVDGGTQSPWRLTARLRAYSYR